MTNLYYEAPTDEQFDDLKKEAIRIWGTYDNQYGYADEKIDRIKDLKNIRDNFMTIAAMFDGQNQFKLAKSIREDTSEAVRERMIAGGSKFTIF